MKLHRLDRSIAEHNSFMVNHVKCPNFLKIWHYHPEMELVYVISSAGTQFIGDGIEKFDKGELTLIGENLPHTFINEEEYFKEGSNLKAEAIIIHFNKDFLGSQFLEAPEMRHISDLFDVAKRGIRFLNVDKRILKEIREIPSSISFDRTMKFLKILDLLAKHSTYQLLSSVGYSLQHKNLIDKRLESVYRFVFNNFKQPMTSKDAAHVADMNPSAFSRFFKRVHRKTFRRYLNEIRIGYACKLLLEGQLRVIEVCYESGFNNISNFNKQFREIKGVTPTRYIDAHVT